MQIIAETAKIFRISMAQNPSNHQEIFWNNLLFASTRWSDFKESHFETDWENIVDRLIFAETVFHESQKFSDERVELSIEIANIFLFSSFVYVYVAMNLKVIKRLKETRDLQSKYCDDE